jgi:hypothetical protein
MTQLLLLPLMVYAACGLVLSVAVHVLSLFGFQLGAPLFTALHVGIFPLWFVVVLLSMKMIGSASRKDFWKIALSGCPPWMRYMTRGFFIYAIVNFAIFFFLTAGQQSAKPAGGDPTAVVLHGFSGHWMAFYSAGLAILTTAYRRGLSNLQRHCPFGHDVGWSDKFCPTCGASIPADPDLA